MWIVRQTSCRTHWKARIEGTHRIAIVLLSFRGVHSETRAYRSSKSIYRRRESASKHRAFQTFEFLPALLTRRPIEKFFLCAKPAETADGHPTKSG